MLGYWNSSVGREAPPPGETPAKIGHSQSYGQELGRRHHRHHPQHQQQQRQEQPHYCCDSLLSEVAEEEVAAAADLIDHTLQEGPALEPRLTWDGRKGQWIPVAYSFTFPASAFDHAPGNSDAQVEGARVEARRLAYYRFPPSKRHSVMLDQGSPRLRILPKAILEGRRPAMAPCSPLASGTGRSLKRTASDIAAETDDEEVAYEPPNPFSLACEQKHALPPSHSVKPLPWLDDIDIEEFLSSAIDYQADHHHRSHHQSAGLSSSIPMSEPVYPHFFKRRRSSPCTPSSPPPPLFLDGAGPIPDFKPSPTHS